MTYTVQITETETVTDNDGELRVLEETSGTLELSLPDGDIQVLELGSETVELLYDNGVDTIAVDGETLNIIEEAIIGPQGPQGPQGIPGSETAQFDAGPIAPSASLVIDSVDASLFRAVQWFLLLKDSVNGKYRTLNINAVHNGTTSTHTIFGVIGDFMNVAIDVQLIAGNIEVEVTNNHSATITVSALRARISI